MWKEIKVLIGILAVAVILAGGWMALQNKQPESSGVTISTDRAKYEQGENITIRARNDLDVPILYSDSIRFWGIERFEDGKWKKVRFQLTEKGINESCYIALYERLPPAEMKSNSTLSQKWNQRICPYEGSTVEYIGTGRYRFTFYYGFERSSESAYKISNPRKIHSNEFIIG